VSRGVACHRDRAIQVPNGSREAKDEPGADGVRFADALRFAARQAPGMDRARERVREREDPS